MTLQFSIKPLSFLMNLQKAPTFPIFQHKTPIFSTYLRKSHNFQPFRSLMDASTACRITRTSRAVAQRALLDYLHSTRSFTYTDAEHVSRNCPAFLQTLIAKVGECNDDMGRSVTRFLRYNPINEFEPFFESLGLKPSELGSVLPRNLFFLSEDGIFLDNYRILCNYGVPRSKIGRMYKDDKYMFYYEDGILISKLQAYEQLGLSRPTIIKLVTCCPALLVGDLNAEFLEVLEKLKGFGVELDWIRGCVSDKSMYKWNRILDMLNFLNRLGCTEKDLAGLIKEHPRFLFDDSGKKFYLLIVMLLKLGLKRVDISVFFENYPRILSGNFTKNLLKSVKFLSKIGMQGNDIVHMVSHYAGFLGSASCMGPKFISERLNISENELCEIIKKDPSKFSDLATRRRKMTGVHLQKIDGIFLKEKIAFLLNLGYIENSDEMAKAIRKFRGRGDQLQERFDCLVNAGLDCHIVAGMIKLVPSVLSQSTDVIEKKLDYLLNHLGYPLESVVVFPTFLCYNLETINVRFSMYRWLENNGVVIRTKTRKMSMSKVALSTVLACSDARFIKQVVNLHPEGPKEWERLKKFSSSS